MIYRRPSVGGVLGILAAIPNILFILARPNAKHIEFATGGHLHMEHHQEIKSEIGKFLAEHHAMESQIL
jgi:hypothetical protein